MILDLPQHAVQKVVAAIALAILFTISVLALLFASMAVIMFAFSPQAFNQVLLPLVKPVDIFAPIAVQDALLAFNNVINVAFPPRVVR